MTKKFPIRRMLEILLLVIIASLFAACLCYLFLDLLFPFTAAFLSAVMLSPLSRRIGKKTRMSLRVLRLFLLFLLMALLSFLLIIGTIKLLDEAGAFFSTLYDRLEVLLQKVFDLLEKWRNRSKTISPTAETLASAIGKALKNAMSSLSAKSASLAAHFAAKLPSMLFSLLIFLLALFYFSFDYEIITAYFHSLVPPKYRPKLEAAKQRILSVGKRFFRAYGLLFALTFAELYLAFLFLKIDHAFLISLIAAALDILPAIGVGVILIPWAVFLLLVGNTSRALVLLGVTLAVTVVRQVAEPHIIGKQFGIHPLASLLSLYLALRLLGVLGILLSPFLALAVSEAINLYRKKINSVTGCEKT